MVADATLAVYCSVQLYRFNVDFDIVRNFGCGSYILFVSKLEFIYEYLKQIFCTSFYKNELTISSAHFL